jgi:hypothetical protein
MRHPPVLGAEGLPLLCLAALPMSAASCGGLGADLGATAALPCLVDPEGVPDGTELGLPPAFFIVYWQRSRTAQKLCVYAPCGSQRNPWSAGSPWHVPRPGSVRAVHTPANRAQCAQSKAPQFPRYAVRRSCGRSSGWPARAAVMTGSGEAAVAQHVQKVQSRLAASRYR